MTKENNNKVIRKKVVEKTTSKGSAIKKIPVLKNSKNGTVTKDMKEWLQREEIKEKFKNGDVGEH